MAKPIDVWFHCWAGNEQFYVSQMRLYSYITEKVNKLKNCGLYDTMNNFYLVAHGVNNKNEKFFDDIAQCFSKLTLIKIFNPAIGHESDTLNLMLEKYKNTDENFNVLFFHTKGFSYPELPTQKNWIRYMDLFMINKWKENQDILKEHDTSGCFFFAPDEKSRKEGEPDNRKTYAGWFWWATSEHLKTIEPFTYRMDRGKGGEFALITSNCRYHVMETGFPDLDLHQVVWCDESIFPIGW
jgi:hypothetical protein